MTNPLEEFDLPPENNPLLDPPKKEKIKDLTLSKEQQLLILQDWEKNPENPPSITDLIRLAWPELEENLIDGRSSYGKIVKEYLTSKFGEETAKIAVQTYKPKKDIELSSEQKEYITNNCSNMRPFEMAKELFKNPRLSPASAECRSVINFVKSLPQSLVHENDIPETNYRPPKQISHVVARIKKYVSEAESWDEKKLTPTQKKCAESLIHYLHDYRFKRQIDNYERNEDKITFESEFIKYTYDKHELEQEEISQYCLYSSLVVMEFDIKAHMEMLKNNIEREYEENDGRIKESLVKALESARQDLGNCLNKQKDLINNLTTKRSDKLSKEIKDKESLLNLFNTWKQFESRQQLLKIRQRDKENLKKELHEIEEMDELRQRVLGLNIDEIIDG